MAGHPRITCPECGYSGELFGFGPSDVFIDDERYEYVNCRRCAAMLLVGRDVEIVYVQVEATP
jgi:DNA-directed RNA polymerase subunit RPC12/RpoP